jgi:hypothetical protein
MGIIWSRSVCSQPNTAFLAIIKDYATKIRCTGWNLERGPRFTCSCFRNSNGLPAYVSLLVLSFLLLDDTTVSNFELFCMCWSPFYQSTSCWVSIKQQQQISLWHAVLWVHRRPQSVSQVIREAKTDRIIQVMVTVQKLQLAASGRVCTMPTQHHK